MSKKHHKWLKHQAQLQLQESALVHNANNKKVPARGLSNSLYLLLAIVILLGIALLAVPSLRDYLFKSSKEKLFEQSHRIGLIIPKEVQARQTVIQLRLGKHNSQDVPISQLRQGMYVNSKLSSACSNDPYKLYMKLEDQKLFLSAEIKSLDGKVIGDLRENKWISKNEVIDYHGDGTTYFEVMDDKKRIPFSISCNGSEILLNGIFVDKDCFVILNDEALVTRDLNEATTRASAIKPFMPFDDDDEN